MALCVFGLSAWLGPISPALALLPTSTTLTTSNATPGAGVPVTLTATVSSLGTPTGTVTFYDGVTSLGTRPLSSGVATLTTSTLSTGSHTITATYSGDGLYNGSTSSGTTEIVSINTSLVSVGLSVSNAPLGSPVTLNATVTGTNGTPTGTVTFKDGLLTVGTATLDAGGVASLTTSLLPVGVHVITAVYGGDANTSPSVSAGVNLTIPQSACSISLNVSLGTILFGGSDLLSVSVTGTGAIPTGNVNFKIAGITVGTATLDGAGHASLTTNILGLGLLGATATYGGDGNFLLCTSPTVNITVNQAATTASVTSSVNPSTYLAPVTFTASITGTGATGTVTFKDGATTIGTGSLNGSGQATFTTSALSTGSHSITAVYGGDTNFTGSTSPALTQTVGQASATTAVASSVNPSTFGASVTFTATVTGTGATGTVTFKDGASTIGTGTLNGSGQATFSTAALAVGTHTITAVYGGDTNYSTSTSSSLSQIVGQGGSTIGLASSANPSAFGASVTFTATVTGTGATATGTVTFKDGATTLGTGTLNGSGQATFSTTSLSPGTHSITAVYGGNTNYTGSTSAALSQDIVANASSTALTSSSNPSTFGSSVTFTATVSGGGGTPTGSVTFKDGATTLGNGTLNGSGQATFATAALAAGNHSITAVYNGDNNFGSSTSSTLAQTVNQAASTTSVASSANPSSFGAPVTFTATVVGSGATGTVTFKDGATTIGTGTLNGSNQATFTTSALSTATHSITAVYAGDTNFTGSTSPALSQSVGQAGSTIAVTSSANPSAFGGSVTFTGTVAAPGATGTVTFKDGVTTLGTGTLNGSGQATFATAALAAGSHSITAIYAGDTNYTGSTSPILTQSVVANASTTALVSSVNPSTFGSSVTFTATVSGSGGTPSGTVVFKDGATTLGSSSVNGGGLATFSTTALAAGSHTITAAYGGDSNYGASTSSAVTQVVTQSASTAAVTSSVNPSNFGSPVTFTATVSGTGGTPSGTVTFKDGSTTLGTGTLNGSGQATLTTSALLAGSHSIIAVYGGDTNFAPATSPVYSQVVGVNVATASVASSANPSAIGWPVTFTATVTGTGVTGTVTFKDGTTTLGTGTLNGSGQTTFSTSSLALGGHPITAVYGGDTNFGTATSPVLSQFIVPHQSGTAMSSSANPSAIGAPVTFKAVVTSASGIIPTGTVIFKNGATTLGSGAVNTLGEATYTHPAFPAGTHSITAVYSGDSNHAASTSAPHAQSVNGGASGTSLAASPNPAPFGTPVNLVAIASGATGTPTGTMTFMDGGTVLGTVPLDGNGQGVMQVNSLSAGTHSMRAVYSGDNSYAASTSPVVPLAVNQSAATVSLVSSLNPSKLGDAVTFTAAATSGSGSPTGTFTFKDGGAVLGTSAISGSTATFTTSALAVGRHSITAVYNGDSNFSAITSSMLTQAVNVPKDSERLRSLQVATTVIVAQNSGAAISGAIDSAIEEGFADGGAILVPSETGLRLNSDGYNANARVQGGFATFEDRRPAWVAWSDLRGVDWSMNPSKGDITGRQVNALGGLTYRFSPEFVAGAFGGYETFDFASQSINGRMTGKGWTVGAYAGWKVMPGIRLDAGIARSGLEFNGTAGTASGTFPASRSLATVGLTGTYKFANDWSIEPSLRAYALWENEKAYVDTLGTAQAERNFMTGRASAGAKLSYRWEMSSTLTIAPYIGLYGDYYVIRDDAATASTPEQGFSGKSGRVTSGLTLTSVGGAQFSVGGEIGGLGGNGFIAKSARMRASIPF